MTLEKALKPRLGGGGEVLRISSDGVDQMGTKIKTKKIPRALNKPQKTPGPKFNPPKIPRRISGPKKFQKAEAVAKQVWFYFIQGTTWSGVHGNYAVT